MIIVTFQQQLTDNTISKSRILIVVKVQTSIDIGYKIDRTPFHSENNVIKLVVIVNVQIRVRDELNPGYGKPRLSDRV